MSQPVAMRTAGGLSSPKQKASAKKPYSQSAALLKEAVGKRSPREAWARLQKALAWMHLEDLAELDAPDARLRHPDRLALYAGIKEQARRHKGKIPYLLGLSLFAEGPDHDLVAVIREIDGGFFPEVHGRWTDRFLADGGDAAVARGWLRSCSLVVAGAEARIPDLSAAAQ